MPETPILCEIGLHRWDYSPRPQFHLLTHIKWCKKCPQHRVKSESRRFLCKLGIHMYIDDICLYCDGKTDARIASDLKLEEKRERERKKEKETALSSIDWDRVDRQQAEMEERRREGMRNMRG